MVEVRHVGMGVHQVLVHVPVAVTSSDGLVVVPVMLIMDVLVIVDEPLVHMRVLMVRTQHPQHTDRGEDERDDLHPADSVTEKHPGDEDTDERCCGEDQLAPGGTEITSAGNPQGDRQAVPEAACDEGEQRVGPGRQRASER